MKKIYSFLAIILCSMLFAGYAWAEDYALWVADVQVSDANKDNITSTYISGKVSYNSATNTLTLENATIISPHGCIENTGESHLKINLIGNNTITSTKNHAIYSEVNFSITGNGSLVASSETNCGIFAVECDLDIKGTSITATGKFGIYGTCGGGYSTDLTIEKSSVKATGTDGSICNFDYIILDSCAITKPSGAYLEDGDVKLNGEVVTEEVVIVPVEEYYDLYVTATRVSSANKDNIASKYITGKASYDPATNTLTLENATLTYPPDECIYNHIKDLKINLIGDNTMTSYWHSVYSAADFSIVGEGTLTTSGMSGIILFKCNLTIEGATVSATGWNGGICNDPDLTNHGVFTIKNATVKAQGGSGSINGFEEIKLEGCAIAKPIGAVIDSGTVKLNGEVVKDEVVIMPGGVGVQETLTENVKIRMQNCQLTVENSAREDIAVYNIMGQVVATKQNPNNTETFILPAAGVYIVKVGKGSTKVIAL